jgi:branched-subunit amino acid transport protein
LTAIVAPGVFTKQHELALSWQNNQMWALVVAGLVFAKTRNMLAMMAVGMTVFTSLRLWG